MRIIVLILLIIHSTISLYCFRSIGVLSVFPPFAELHTLQIFSDLSASITLVILFIWREIRGQPKANQKVVALSIATILAGSFAPLIYILLNKEIFKAKSL